MVNLLDLEFKETNSYGRVSNEKVEKFINENSTQLYIAGFKYCYGNGNLQKNTKPQECTLFIKNGIPSVKTQGKVLKIIDSYRYAIDGFILTNNYNEALHFYNNQIERLIEYSERQIKIYEDNIEVLKNNIFEK